MEVTLPLAPVFSELVRLETELWNAADARLRAECALTLGRLETMQVIERQPRCRVQDVASALAITVGGASKIVDRLETAGHCRRRANPGDRRSSLLELTPAGRRLLSAATVTFEDVLARRFAGVGGLAEFGAKLTALRAAGHAADAALRSAA